MKLKPSAWTFLLLMGAICVRADIFDQISIEGQTNKLDFSKSGVLFSPDGSTSSTNAAATNQTTANPYAALPDATNKITQTPKWQAPASDIRAFFEETKTKAEKGDAIAQYNLGCDYYFGHGVAPNYTEAVKWYLKSAEQNYPNAEYNLGNCYYNGQGVTQDAGEAAKWFGKAAAQGKAEAQGVLGMCYYQGLGVSRDYSQAAVWFQKAAEQGNARGQAMLAQCYRDGAGLPKNDIEAYKWFSLAAAHEWRNSYADNDFADYIRQLVIRELDACQARMSREEIIEAQRLAAAFVPKKEMQDSNSSNSNSPENPTATGTGFFITDDGYLISNNHVVKNATKIRLVTSAGLIDAKVVQVDAANDLALLKAGGRFAPLPIAASRTVALGGTVATVGFPDIGLQGFAPKLAKGEIASLSGAGDDPRYFQISVPVQPGNSGGALVDDRGNVIGIVSAKLNASVALAESGALPENVNYAVKSSFLLGFLESVPAVSAKLKAPNTADRKFEDVVKSAQDAAVLVLVY